MTHLPRLLIGFALSAAAPLLLSSPSQAQMVGGEWETLWQFNGQAYDDRLGTSVSGAGDIDGDGFGDLIVGAYSADIGGEYHVGSAYVYSGATGALLWQFDGQTESEFFGISVSGAGDVNGDGFADVIIGAPYADPQGRNAAGSAYVYSGATGFLLWQFDGEAETDNMGASVSAAGDINGDGYGDVIVGANRASPGGRSWAGSAYVFSGSTGNLLWRFDGQAIGDDLGGSVSDAGDVNGDGIDDLIVGASTSSPGGDSQVGAAYIFSGATGQLLWRLKGQVYSGRFGESVSGAGDTNQDGHADVIVGASGTGSGMYFLAGSAYVYSGATGQLLWQFDGQEIREFLGGSVSGAGDVDQDGFADVLIGASGASVGAKTDAGTATIYSGATGKLLRQFQGQSEFDFLGSSISQAGDVNADGSVDLIVGANFADPGGIPNSGAAFVYSLNPYLRSDQRNLSASAGGVMSLTVDFPTSEAGQAFALRGSASGNGPWAFLGTDLPLTPDKLTWRMATNPPPMFQGIEGTLDSAGDAIATIDVPPGAWTQLVGRSLWFAAYTLHPGPVIGEVSVAVAVEVLP